MLLSRTLNRYLLSVLGSILSVLIPYNDAQSAGTQTTGLSEAGDAFTAALVHLNGDVFWAPASGFAADSSWPNVFGDEARSVFGPIPAIDCTSHPGSTLSVEYGGNRVELREISTGEYAWEHRSATGSVLEVSEELRTCDKPSLANTDGHFCGTSSRISVLNNDDNENVAWVALCRKSERFNRITSWDDYWHPRNPRFALLGIIGFNSLTGELVFFDGTDRDFGRSRVDVFDWIDPYPPPGGYGYNDHAGRSVARDLYAYSKQISCETCHDNKEPWIITPHLKYHGYGYRNSAHDQRLGTANVLPLVQPRPSDAPYRVIGSRYTRMADLSSKTFEDPTGSCTYCHTLTTDWTGDVLAFDAVGRVNPLDSLRAYYQRLDDSRTDWAKRPGNTRPWMVPWLGPNVNPGWKATEISEDNWRRIAACINETSDEDCQYKNVYTACPAPESVKTTCTREDEAEGTCTRLADPFGPSEITSYTTTIEEDIEALPGYTNLTTMSWSYLNGLGGVPQRDDVRFNLMVREVGIPEDGDTPDFSDFPDQAKAEDPYAGTGMEGRVHYCDLGRKRARICHHFDPDKGEFFVNNISFTGHTRNTTPEPAFEPRRYTLKIPTQCGKRYLARLVPKRFCFDRSGVLASEVDHLHYFDVRCDAGSGSDGDL